jgi:hypothetical protein
VLGVVTIERGGITPGLTSPHVVIGWFHHTPLWGLIDLVLGVGMLGAAAARAADRSRMAVFGALAALFGTVLVIEPDAFHGALGIHADTGWLFLAVGIVTGLAGLRSARAGLNP